MEPLKIQLQGIESESMLWELREYDVSIKSPNFLEDTSNPDVIITTIDSAPLVSENLMGQDFVLAKVASWSLMSSREYLDWALSEPPIYNKQECIVWADLYEGSLEVVEDPLPDEDPTAQ